MASKSLTDIAVSRPAKPSLEFPLDQVGMENISTRVKVLDSSGIAQVCAAQVNTFVSLDKASARGIHMSRLYKQVNELDQEVLSQEYLFSVLDKMLVSHKDLSQSAYLQVDFNYLVRRKALLSQTEGWRSYPISICAQSKNGVKRYQMLARVEYSSTCPCSASLSREAIQQKFSEDFSEDFKNQSITIDQVHQWLSQESSIVAVPHSQRSEAKVLFEFSKDNSGSIVRWLDVMEEALGTPVQAAVKREDEQEFARLNGQNLMFCEDAARKLKAALLSENELKDFSIEVRHFESLHAHDVVARCGKSY